MIVKLSSCSAKNESNRTMALYLSGSGLIRLRSQLLLGHDPTRVFKLPERPVPDQETEIRGRLTLVLSHVHGQKAFFFAPPAGVSSSLR